MVVVCLIYLVVPCWWYIYLVVLVLYLIYLVVMMESVADIFCSDSLMIHH